MKQKCPKCNYSAQVTFGLLGVCVHCGTHPHQFERDLYKEKSETLVSDFISALDDTASEASEEGALWIARAKERAIDKVSSRPTGRAEKDF